MKKLFIITAFMAMGIILAGCGAEGNDTGRAYAPDMYYSRAYETYGYNNVTEEGIYTDLYQKGIYYNAAPVPGTMARGEVSRYPYPGTDSGYAMSANYISTFDTVATTPAQMKEAERLYLIHCGICHGANLDGNGPLWNGGNGPYPAAPRNLLDDYSKALPTGKMHHVIIHGKGLMGSYSSQIRGQQRAWIVKYIKEKQAGTAAAGTDTTGAAATTPAADTTNTTN